MPGTQRRSAVIEIVGAHVIMASGDGLTSWLADCLAMRRAANVSQLLRRATQAKNDSKLPKRVAAFVGRAMVG